MRVWFIVALLVLMAAWGRVWWSARSELEAAKNAERAGQLELAIEHYHYAARWFTPGADAPKQSRAALVRIGQAATENGDSELALKAFRRLRRAILGTRGLLEPGVEDLKATNERIAVLMAKVQYSSGAATIQGRTETQLYEHHLALLELDPIPNRYWSLVVIFSFFAWIMSIIMAIRHGFDAELTVRRSKLLTYSVSFLAFFSTWLVALSNA